jgi:hypothetical protein
MTTREDGSITTTCRILFNFVLLDLACLAMPDRDGRDNASQ